MIKLLILIFLSFPLFGKNLYFTRSGSVSFFSSTPIEDIKAKNDQVTCVLDAESGQASFRIPIRGFTFKNALMQEHFNENYLESEKYPNASFSGFIEGWKDTKFNAIPTPIMISGEMTIHGIKQKIKENGTIQMKNNKIYGNATFNLFVADYGVEIPKIVRENIAKSLSIDIELILKKK
jgi:polyisoprenoid-binding protein YceI